MLAYCHGTLVPFEMKVRCLFENLRDSYFFQEERILCGWMSVLTDSISCSRSIIHEEWTVWPSFFMWEVWFHKTMFLRMQICGVLTQDLLCVYEFCHCDTQWKDDDSNPSLNGFVGYPLPGIQNVHTFPEGQLLISAWTDFDWREQKQVY